MHTLVSVDEANGMQTQYFNKLMDWTWLALHLGKFSSSCVILGKTQQNFKIKDNVEKGILIYLNL